MSAPGLADPALQHLIDQVQAARAQSQTLDIRGLNTKAFYGNKPTGQPLLTTGGRSTGVQAPAGWNQSAL